MSDFPSKEAPEIFLKSYTIYSFVIVKVQASAKECNRVRQHTALFLAQSAVRNAVWAPKIFYDYPTRKCVTAQTLAVKTTTNSEIHALFIGVTVEEFGRMLRMSERAAWTIIRREADKPNTKGASPPSR